jgi:HD-like signal output (HDOD) protein
VIAHTQPSVELIERALEGSAKLPPFSPVLNKLLASLADEDISFGSIASLIEKDTVLSGSVLRLVNSALYGRRGTVNSVRHAVLLMGMAKVRNAAMSLSVSRLWHKLEIHPTWAPLEFNLHGVACALIADQLAPEMTVEYPEGAFAAGLLHQVGLLLLAIALQEQYGELIVQVRAESERSLYECEMSLFGFSHGELSARLLQRWNLPKPIVDAVRGICMPNDPAPGSLALLLKYANTLSVQRGLRVQGWMPAVDGTPQETLEKLGLAEKSEAILAAWEMELEAIRAFFS